MLYFLCVFKDCKLFILFSIFYIVIYFHYFLLFSYLFSFAMVYFKCLQRVYRVFKCYIFICVYRFLNVIFFMRVYEGINVPNPALLKKKLSRTLTLTKLFPVHNPHHASVTSPK